MNFMDGDSNFELILYLIIVVGGILVNAYRSMTKKKAEERKRREPANEHFPDFEEEPVFNTPAESEYIFETEEEQQPIQPEPEVVLENVREELKEGIEAFSQAKAELLSVETEELGNSFSLDVQSQDSPELTDKAWDEKSGEGDLKTFDLKTAIIYSEIINAKYI